MSSSMPTTYHPSLQTLKARILAAYIIRTRKGFRSRVEVVIAAEGGYIE